MPFPQDIDVLYAQVMGEQGLAAQLVGREWLRFAEALRKAARQLRAVSDGELADWQSPAARQSYDRRSEQIASEVEAIAEDTAATGLGLTDIGRAMIEAQQRMDELHDDYLATMREWDAAGPGVLVHPGPPAASVISAQLRAEIERSSRVGLSPGRGTDRQAFKALWDAAAVALAQEIAGEYAPGLARLSGAAFPLPATLNAGGLAAELGVAPRAERTMATEIVTAPGGAGGAAPVPAGGGPAASTGVPPAPAPPVPGVPPVPVPPAPGAGAAPPGRAPAVPPPPLAAGLRPPALAPGGVVGPPAAPAPRGLSGPPPGTLLPPGVAMLPRLGLPPPGAGRRPDQPDPATPGQPGEGSGPPPDETPAAPGAGVLMVPPGIGAMLSGGAGSRPVTGPDRATRAPAVPEAFLPPGAPPPVLGDRTRRSPNRPGGPAEVPAHLPAGVGPGAGGPPVLENRRRTGPTRTYTELREAARRARRDREQARAVRPASAFATGLPEVTAAVLARRVEPAAAAVRPATEEPAGLRPPRRAPGPGRSEQAHRRPTPADPAGAGPPPATRTGEAIWEVETPGGPVVAANRPASRSRPDPPPALGAQG